MAWNMYPLKLKPPNLSNPGSPDGVSNISAWIYVSMWHNLQINLSTDTRMGATVAGGPAILRGPRRPDLLRPETLPDLLAATASRQPESPALVWGDQTVSYAGLFRAATAIAASLNHHGAAPGQVIGLFLPRGADLLFAQAGITHSGAAWLPFDAATPVERIKVCLQSAQATGLLTCRAWLPRLADVGVPVWAVEDLLEERILPLPPVRPVRPEDPAYVIYTSGSTGTPKGIVIRHQSICHFLRSENVLLGITAADRVYQGFSVAFDMSFEEIWISWLAGATLWIAPPELVADPDALALTLTRERITVLHAVPTLVSLMPPALPSLRLLNLGGEACLPALAQRLVRPGLKVFNTYGPTETSVSASLAELKSGGPVTIGWPLPNYGLVIVDEQRRPVATGETGELCIFGPGLAQGYLGLPALTAEKFIANPLAADSAEAVMYLTGDLARMEPGGPVHCLGRADNQVKIRGFRVELDEINSVLNAQPGVGAGAVVIRALAGGGEANEELVAFVIPSAANQPAAAGLRAALAARLPGYMVPAHFEFVAELPRLASGKINVNALRTLPLKSMTAQEKTFTARTEGEIALVTALGKLFPGRALWPEADFFDDLGGHSLLVARLVSVLRNDARYATVSVQDVYRERRLDGLARTLDRLRQRQPGRTARRAPIPAGRRYACGLAQAVFIPFFVLLNMADWLAPFFVYQYFTGDPGDSIPRAIGYSLITFVLARFANFAIAIAGKWLVNGRLKPGRYPLWGVAYFRWWLGNRFCDLPDTYLLASTPWMPLYLRCLGARIGRDVMIDTITIGAPDLLTVGDGASVGTFVNFENARVEGGELILGPITIGRDAVVESYSVLENDTALGANAQLCGLSALADGRKVPAGEIWDGAPARKTGRVAEPLPPRPQIGFARQWLQAILFGLSALFVSVLFFLPVFPAFILIDWVDANTLDVFDSDPNPVLAFGFFFLLAIPAATLFLFATALFAAGLRWILPRQQPGTFSVHSAAFWRKKFVTQIIDGSLRELHGLYASVFAPAWLRCLGMKIGRHAEVSTAEGMVPELLTLGDDSFVADGAMLGDEDQRGGWMTLRPTRIGSRSFVGNGAYIPDGAVVPDDALIGVQTRVPENDRLKSGQTWMGSPPLLLPAREQITGFPDSLTFRPPLLRRLGRGLVEGLRIVLPLAFVIASGYLIIIFVMPLAAEDGWGFTVANALALAGCLFGVVSFLLVVALKWLLIGRYQPRAAPMWTAFVWISEAVTNLYESLAVPNFLDHLCGTPALPWALRLLGAHIGRGVFLDTTDLTEFDCVHIGDEAELNSWSGPQNHLFEDRVMKIGLVKIGARVTVGARATILYDTEVGDDVRLGPLTLVAKGEHLPPGTRWEGAPAAPADEP